MLPRRKSRLREALETLAVLAAVTVLFAVVPFEARAVASAGCEVAAAGLRAVVRSPGPSA